MLDGLDKPDKMGRWVRQGMGAESRTRRRALTSHQRGRVNMRDVQAMKRMEEGKESHSRWRKMAKEEKRGHQH